MSTPKTPPANYSEALRQRADDVTSLSHFVGPQSIAAVQSVLRILADIEDGKTEYLYTAPPVHKRRLE